MSSIKKQGISFLIWLLAIELCWILGTKVSEILIDYIVELSFQEIQLAESFFSYTIALTIFFWGYLVDRFNNKRKVILTLSSLLWISGSFMLFFIPINFFTYSLIQIMWGLSFGANGPLIASYLGDMFKIEKRGKLFSSFTIFIYIIKGSNIAINGLIGESLGNWKAPTFIFAIIGIIIILAFNILSSEPKIASIEPEFEEERDFLYSYYIHSDDIKYILRKRTNALFLAQGISGMIGVTIVTKYMIFWFTSGQYDGLNIDTGLALLLLGTGGAIGGLVGILIAGRWIDHQFKKNLINRILLFSIICLFMQVVFYSILILGINYPNNINRNINRIDTFLQLYPAFIGFILIFNLCVFCGTPVGTTVGVARTHINLPEHRGTAGALYDLTDFIGAGFGIMLGTIFIIILNSFRLTILYGALFWLISGVIWLFIAKFIKQDYEKAREILKERAKLEN
ncbi:MAG: MFS transporter [Promethearchaeota archaeon]|nr:MAG: MFS transporter [Candidatus Lokiarchaeota archaeon]